MSSQHTWRGDAVVTALVSLAESTLGSAVAVIDGPPLTKASLPAYLSIGWTPDDASIRVERTTLQGFASHVTEVGEIECRLVAQGGDVDVPGFRATVTGYLEQIDAALRADPTLGDAVDEISLGAAIHGIPISNAAGSGYRLDFSIRYEAVL